MTLAVACMAVDDRWVALSTAALLGFSCTTVLHKIVGEKIKGSSKLQFSMWLRFRGI